MRTTLAILLLSGVILQAQPQPAIPLWSGDVPGALENIAETYENELTLQLRVMTNLIEPVMIIVMAVGVGGLLFSILSAMFAITSSINRG